MCVFVSSTFSNSFSSEISEPTEAKFHVEPPWVGGTKVCSNGPRSHDQDGRHVHNGKNLNNLRNQTADDLETWYVASGA